MGGLFDRPSSWMDEEFASNFARRPGPEECCANGGSI
jgi:hypothetical protein